MPSAVAPLRLLIKPLIEQAQALAARVAADLPTHEGLQRAARMVVAAAEKAERIAAAQNRPWSPHRLPVMFLSAALVGLVSVLYWQFFHASTLSLALPDRDAVMLREHLSADARVNVRVVDVRGSREAAELVEKGEVDLAFIQGGVAIPARLMRLETPTHEPVLYFVRDRVAAPGDVKTVLTSIEGEGSHSVAKEFFGAWGAPVAFVHTWHEVTANPQYLVPDAVDAAFVVKDPGDEQALRGAERLFRQGFRLESPSLGARASRFEYLTPYTLPRGHLATDPALPAAPVETYAVSTFLVARQGLTPRRLTQAANVIDAHPRTIAEGSFRLSTGEASEIFQGVDALFSVLVNIGLAFLALLGLDVFAYRKPFHELNSLVSLVGLLQSSKDVLGVAVAQRAENLRYLSLCSDMLSLISAIGGFHTQENSSLLFNSLPETVHQRCDALKINIQLKLLHAMVNA